MATNKPTEGGAAGHTPEARDTTMTAERERPGAGSELQGSEQANRGQGREVEVSREAGGAVQQQRRGGTMAFNRDPLFASIQRLSDEMDELFDSFFYGRPVQRWSRQSQLQNLWAPEVELCEEGNRLRICVDLPGVSKENVKVDVQEGMLTIQGERREERTEGGEQQGFRRSERRYGSFYRSIPLPENAESENAQANMKDGVLEIIIPVTPAKQPHRLEIQ